MIFTSSIRGNLVREYMQNRDRDLELNMFLFLGNHRKKKHYRYESKYVILCVNLAKNQKKKHNMRFCFAVLIMYRRRTVLTADNNARWL